MSKALVHLQPISSVDHLNTSVFSRLTFKTEPTLNTFIHFCLDVKQSKTSFMIIITLDPLIPDGIHLYLNILCNKIKKLYLFMLKAQS